MDQVICATAYALSAIVAALARDPGRGDRARQLYFRSDTDGSSPEIWQIITACRNLELLSCYDLPNTESDDVKLPNSLKTLIFEAPLADPFRRFLHDDISLVNLSTAATREAVDAVDGEFASMLERARSKDWSSLRRLGWHVVREDNEDVILNGLLQSAANLAELAIKSEEGIPEITWPDASSLRSLTLIDIDLWSGWPGMRWYRLLPRSLFELKIEFSSAETGETGRADQTYVDTLVEVLSDPTNILPALARLDVQSSVESHVSEYEYFTQTDRTHNLDLSALRTVCERRTIELVDHPLVPETTEWTFMRDQSQIRYDIIRGLF